MLLEDKFITTSSKFSTSKNSSASGIGTPIQFVKGVGPRLGAIFNSRNIETVQDLLYFFPRAYQDRSEFQAVSSLTDGMVATLSVQVQSQRQIPIQKLGRTLLEVRCADETGALSLKWFHSLRGMEKKFVPGAQMVVTGKVKLYQGRPEMVHPEITWGGTSAETIDAGPGQAHAGRVVPIYTEIEGVSTRILRNILWEAVEKFGSTLQEDLPLYLLERRGIPQVADAVRALHFPPEQKEFDLTDLGEFATPAHQRLIYGEFFKFEYLMLRRKVQGERACSPLFIFSPELVPGHPPGHSDKKLNAWLTQLPFELTKGQAQALKNILDDFGQPYPMNRLVQGDVGSGKTAVAFLTAARVLEEGAQAALMVPTEILAEQHMKSALKLFQGRLNVALLTGKTPQSERVLLQSRLNAGEPLLLIGTHALLEEPVQFSNLAYIMVDEQHRFGVEQRRTLRNKGARTNANGQSILPHSLILTATPIPRTLALTAFGDLSVTSISDLPPGRSPIKTRVLRDKKQRAGAYEKIRAELASGRQAYFIYPLVNASEAEGFTQLKSAVAEAESLAREVFPEFSVGLLHGQLGSDEKARVMNEFQNGKLTILVSTTVVEVGVDVPNATIMVIEHAERFGLSQLHQLRGRVGRGRFQSSCYLLSSTRAEGSTHRLEILEDHSDGFKIAEADLEIRGPGEFLGTRQAGGLPFKIANLVRDREWLFKAREDALEITSKDPDLRQPEHHTLRNYYECEGGIQFDRLQTF